MAKYRSLTSVSVIASGDVLELPGRALNIRDSERVRVYVEDVFYGPATRQDPQGPVIDFKVYPLLPAAQAQLHFGFLSSKFVRLTQPGSAGIPQDSVLVPVAFNVANSIYNLHIPQAGKRVRDDDVRDVVQLAGNFDRSHPDMEAILDAIASVSHDDRPRQSRTGFRTQDWDRFKGMKELSTPAKYESDNERKALEGRRRYTKRKPDAKKPGRKKQNVTPVTKNDLTLQQTTSVFSLSFPLRHLFNRLQAREDTKKMSLLEVVTMAEKQPDLLKEKAAAASDASIASVIARGLESQGGYIADPTLLKFLKKFMEKKEFLARRDPEAHSDEAKLYASINTFAQLAALDRKIIYGLEGVGPRNMTPVMNGLASTLRALEARGQGDVDLDLAELTRELKALRATFQTEAIAINSGTASEELKARYQEPASKAPGQTPRYFHRKVITPDS